MDSLYYIRTKGFVGNCLLFWRPKREGYTCNLDEAGKYEELEAREICKVRKGQDTMYPCHLVDKKAQRHVTSL